jgi:arylsulfatase A-like enzyme
MRSALKAPWSSMFSGSRRWPAFAAVVLACLAVSCGSGSKQFNVVIIGVDTLRRDHLGCYGYERGVSPNIDRLASQGVLFEDAVSQSPWTLPSFATILTSLYPSQHGAGFLEPGAGAYGNRMRTSFPPLAMVLLKHGYSTGAIINAPALAPEFGVDRGFEYYDTTPRWDDRTADRTTSDALAWIDKNSGNRFFMFVHYFDPHVPYSPPAPYDTIYDPGYSGRIGDSFERDTYIRMQEALSREYDPNFKADWDHIKALYDGEIAFTDKAVGDLIKGLEDRGLRGNTLVVFLSDHGEEFFDHKGFEHGHTLYDELIRVPLIFSLPGTVPEKVRIAEQVRHLDVMPTVLDILGIRPTTHLEGVSLKPLMNGEGSVETGAASLLPQKLAFSESMLYGTEKKSIAAYPWKLIYDTVTEERMLFNLAHDPGEHNNLIAEEPDVRAALEEVLFKALFGVSETWYVELAGGAGGHRFDVSLSASERPISGKFKMYKLFDSAGRLMGEDRMRLTEASDNVLRLDGLDLKGTVTLAFKATPKLVPLEIDLRIDGEPATDRTFLGESLSSPKTMPFKQRASREGPSKGAPGERPKPPYILIWHSLADYEVDTPVNLGDATKQKLKALGYIQ